MSESVEREDSGMASESCMSEQHDSSLGLPPSFSDGQHSTDLRDHQKEDQNDLACLEREKLLIDLKISEKVNKKLEEDLKRSQEDLKQSQESIKDLEKQIKKKDSEISQLLDKIQDEKSSSFLQKKIQEQQARIKELEEELGVKGEEQRDDLYRGEDEQGEEEEEQVEPGEDTSVHIDIKQQGVRLQASPPSSLTSLCPVGLGMSTTPCGRCNTCVKIKESNQQETLSCTTQTPAKPDEERAANKNQEPDRPFLTTTKILGVLAVILAIIVASANYPSNTESGPKLQQFAPLMKEYEEKMSELVKTETVVQQMIQERQEKIQEIRHSVELYKKDAETVITDWVKVFIALGSCIDRSRAVFMDRIEEKQKTSEKQAEGFIKELQKEITQLEERMSYLERLSHTEDQLVILLLNISSINTLPPTKDWAKVNVHQPSYVNVVWTAVDQLEKTLGEEMEKLRDAELKMIQEYAVDVTLDPDTAHRWLMLSGDGKQVSVGDTRNDVPDNKERYSLCFNVLGKQSFSSGRFYYEVQVKGKTRWSLGVARESINRKGQITLIPDNGYWTMWLRDEEYWARAGPGVLLSVKEKLQTVGVFVDYEEGLVSFYDVETRVHLYSYTGCSFTEKLYPFFSPESNHGGINSAPLIISPVSVV